MKDKNNRTVVYKVRLTPKEHTSLCKSAEAFNSIASFVRSAIVEFSCTDAKSKIENAKQLAIIYKRIDSELGHIGGNVNQAVHRCNELNAVGTLTVSALQTIVLPELVKCRQSIAKFREELFAITRKVTLSV